MRNKKLLLPSGHAVEMSGNGTPVVFIHPPFMGKAVFKYQQSLNRFCTVILYDILGHGFSRQPDEPITISALRRQLRTLLDELGIKQAVLCGYSSGGSVAQDFAIHYPERTGGLILCGGFSEVSTRLLKLQFAAGIKLVSAGKMGLLASILAKSHRINAVHERELYKYALLANREAVLEFYKAGQAYSSTAKLQLINVPIWLVYGARDVYIHSYMDLFMQRASDVRPIFVSQAAHQLPTKHYRVLNHILWSYVTGPGPR